MPEIETNNSIALTNAEQTLLLILGVRASSVAGSFARRRGWPQPSEKQSRELVGEMTKALTHLIRGMRQPGAGYLTDEVLSPVLDGIAFGSLEKILGPVPEPQTTN